MTEVAAVTAISGKGFVGDTSFGRRIRQVLIVDLGTLNEFGLRPGDIRENVTLEGFNLSDLAAQDELLIGEALFTITGACEPCSQLEDLRPGLRSDIKGNRGVLARVVRGGELKLGDPVSLSHGDPATSAP